MKTSLIKFKINMAYMRVVMSTKHAACSNYFLIAFQLSDDRTERRILN